LVSQKSKDLIEEYVRRKGKATKNEIQHYISYVAEPPQYRVSRKTALALIDEMGNDRLSIAVSSRRGQSHFVTINHESEFHRIKGSVSDLKKLLNSLCVELPQKIIQVSKLGTVRAIDNHFNGLIFILQIVIYSEFTSLGNSIEKSDISREDKEILYHMLWEALIIGNKLNRIMLPKVFIQTRHLSKEIEGASLAQKISYNKIIGSIEESLKNFQESIIKRARIYKKKEYA
jgi:hypothetical protein